MKLAGNMMLLRLLLLLICLGSSIVGVSFAHPEDDFCGPDSGIDPVLCAQLAELNSSEADLSHPLVGDDGEVLTPLEAAWYFLKIGVGHILPGGADHILFVLALFLASPSLRTLALQISVFTVAHTATLGLTAAGVIEPPASIVEPLIALSIAFVALENVFLRGISRWRYAIVFGFGLFHGMGFAGFIREIGLPTDQFWSSLIGFNIGVEVGQLFAVFLALLISILVKRFILRTDRDYQMIVVRPLSVLIAAVGVWWFITRSVGAIF